jgi:hypothetical protein
MTAADDYLPSGSSDANGRADTSILPRRIRDQGLMHAGSASWIKLSRPETSNDRVATVVWLAAQFKDTTP